ncbi:MAG: acyl-CoA thioesterase [Bacteroidia bacterium]
MEIEIRIDWSEMDLFGHVNNVMFAKYIQAARVNFMEGVGIIKSYNEVRLGFMVAATSVVYLKPLYYPDTIRIRSNVKEIKNTSFILHHEIYNSENALCATGEDVIVYFDFNKESKQLISKELKAMLIG